MSEIQKKAPVKFSHPSTDYAGFVLKNYDYAKPLLEKVMENGKRLSEPVPLEDIKAFRQSEIDSLDRTYRRLLNPHTYKVSLSENLKNHKSKLINEIKNNSGIN